MYGLPSACTADVIIFLLLQKKLPGKQALFFVFLTDTNKGFTAEEEGR